MSATARDMGVCKVSDSEEAESIRLKNQPVKAGLLLELKDQPKRGGF